MKREEGVRRQERSSSVSSLKWFVRSEQPRRPLPRPHSLVGNGVGGLGFFTHIFKLDALVQ